MTVNRRIDSDVYTLKRLTRPCYQEALEYHFLARSLLPGLACMDDGILVLTAVEHGGSTKHGLIFYSRDDGMS